MVTSQVKKATRNGKKISFREAVCKAVGVKSGASDSTIIEVIEMISKAESEAESCLKRWYGVPLAVNEVLSKHGAKEFKEFASGPETIAPAVDKLITTLRSIANSGRRR